MFNHFNNYIFTPCAINVICVVTVYNFFAASILFIVNTINIILIKTFFLRLHIRYIIGVQIVWDSTTPYFVLTYIIKQRLHYVTLQS